MTEWAHYVVVSESGNRSPYEDGWGAVWLEHDILAGPDVVLPFVRSRTPGLSRDATWCEAAAVIDLREKDLLFFTTGWGPATNRLRRAYWDLLARAWPGWRVRWAYDATYPGAVGTPDAPILGVEAVAPADDRLSDRDSGLTLVTIEAGGCHLVDHIDHPAVEGPALLDHLKAAPDHVTCGITVSGGVHLDPPRRTMSWWTVGAHRVDVAALWPGWRVECWEDRVHEHVHASAGRFTPPRSDHHADLDEVAQAAREHWSTRRPPELAAPALAVMESAHRDAARHHRAPTL